MVRHFLKSGYVIRFVGGVVGVAVVTVVAVLLLRYARSSHAQTQDDAALADAIQVQLEADIDYAADRIYAGKPEAAIPTLEAVVSDPAVSRHTRDSARVRLMEAYCLTRQYGEVGDLAHAIVSDSANGNTDPDHVAYAFLWAGRALKNAGAGQQAIDTLQGAIDRATTDKQIAFDAYIERARIYNDMGDPSAALAEFDQAQQCAINNNLPRRDVVQAVRELAEAAYAQGYTDYAVARLRASIPDVAQLGEDDVETARRIAQMLDANQRIAWLRHVAKPDQYGDPTAVLVQTQLQQNASVASGGPVNAQYYRQRELALYLWGQAWYADAAAAFFEAANAAPNAAEQAEMLQRAAQAQARSGDPDGGVATMQQSEATWQAVALGADGDDARKALRYLSIGYDNADDPAEQVALFEALVVDPQLAAFPGRRCYAMRRLGELYWSRHRNDDARRIYQQALSEYGNQAFGPAFDRAVGEVMVRLAYLDARAGDFDRAFALCDDMVHGWCQETSWKRWAGKAGKRHKQVIRRMQERQSRQ